MTWKVQKHGNLLRLGRFFGGKKNKEKAQKIGRGGLFSFLEIQKFAPNWPNMQKLNRHMAEIWPRLVKCDNYKRKFQPILVKFAHIHATADPQIWPKSGKSVNNNKKISPDFGQICTYLLQARMNMRPIL